MKIKQGTILRVEHQRKGTFNARAFVDFDSTTEEFYPLILVSEDVAGRNKDWVDGEEIPCRASLCKISIVK